MGTAMVWVTSPSELPPPPIGNIGELIPVLVQISRDGSYCHATPPALLLSSQTRKTPVTGSVVLTAPIVICGVERRKADPLISINFPLEVILHNLPSPFPAPSTRQWPLGLYSLNWL